MRHFWAAIGLVLCLAAPAAAQNWTVQSGSNILTASTASTPVMQIVQNGSDGLLTMKAKSNTVWAVDFTGGQTITINGTGTTITSGLVLRNTTGANGTTTAQYSPRLLLSGTAWDVDDARSRDVSFFLLNRPATHATTVYGDLLFGYVNPVTAAVTYPLSLSSAGVLTSLSGIVSGAGLTLAAGNAVGITSTGYFSVGSTPASGLFRLQDATGANGVALYVGTNNVLKLWTQTSTTTAIVDAALTASDIQISGQLLARESFDQPHYVVENDFTAKVLTDGGINLVLGSPSGVVMFREEIAKTASSWVEAAGVLDIDADATNDEGVEIYLGDLADYTSAWLTTGQAQGACFEVNFTLGDNAGTDQFLIGWRRAEALRDDNVYTGYSDWSVVGINNVDGSIFSLGEVNNAGTLSDDSGVNMADGETRGLKSCITATTRVPTAAYTANGGTTYTAITMTNSATAKTTAIPMNPFITYMNAAGADPGIRINWWQVTRY